MIRTIDLIPEKESLTIGGLVAVLDAIDPWSDFPIKGKVLRENLSWSVQGHCREHPGNAEFSLQYKREEVQTVLKRIRHLRKEI